MRRSEFPMSYYWERSDPEKQARVELKNFSDNGKRHQEEERIRKVDSKRLNLEEQDEVIPGVYVR